MPGFIDDLVPQTAGDKLIKLELRKPFEVLRAYSPIEISVTLTGDATTSGVAFPLEMTVMGPSKKLFKRTFFRRVVPSVLTFTPQEGGVHLVRLSETSHMFWWGALRVTVIGEKAS